jgi:putative flavoprotein involved in K+ transport
MTLEAQQVSDALTTGVELRPEVQQWLDQLSAAFTDRDAGRIESLFADGATLRDLMVFRWDLGNCTGPASIAALLTGDHGRSLAQGFGIREGDLPTLDEMSAPTPRITTFITAATQIGDVEGFVSLSRNPDGSLAGEQMVLQLVDLEGHEVRRGQTRPHGRKHLAVRDRPRPKTPAERFDEEDPTVIVVGSGHNGLVMGARLDRLNVPTLVVERNASVGDNWRNRYGALAMHDPVECDTLPYFPLPETSPRFLTKDQYADYLESYAKVLEIPVWTSTTVESTEYDAASGQWVVQVRRADGSTRVMRCQHLVMATGHNNIARVPELPGQTSFQGETVHSSAFREPGRWRDKKVVVIGAGVSGHDVSQELWENGADVTLIQRSGVYIIDLPTIITLAYTPYINGEPPFDVDLKGAANIFGQLPHKQGEAFTQAAAQMDKELHDSLEAAGFKLGWGPDGQGLFGLVFRENKFSYYYNVGASQLVADGSIKVKQGSPTEFTPAGIKLDDGSELSADLVVFATGYKTVRDSSRELIGDLADDLVDVSVVGSDGEVTGAWRPTGVDRLWFAVSTGIYYGRFYSKFLALHIKAIEEGIAPLPGHEA